jgi:hypothetical protein
MKRLIMGVPREAYETVCPVFSPENGASDFQHNRILVPMDSLPKYLASQYELLSTVYPLRDSFGKQPGSKFWTSSGGVERGQILVQ